MPVSDTTPPAQARQLEVHRRLSGEQRLLLALDMSMFARELAKAKIRSDHSEWSERQISLELIRLAFLPKKPPSDLR
jgi:hypothetical protein